MLLKFWCEVCYTIGVKLTEPFLTDPKQIKAWLDSMGIKDWSINTDGLVDVAGTVDLERKLDTLKRLPVKFGEVDGKFCCRNNQLISLEGAPKQVGEDFYCGHNFLTSLEGTPKEVGGYFNCQYNRLVSLDGAPKKIGGDFICYSNRLSSLKGAPKEVGLHFSCSSNQLVSLEGAPKKVVGDFYCDNNQLESLKGMPKQVGGDFWCDHNFLEDFKGMEGTSIRGSLIVVDPRAGRVGQDNVITSLNGLPKDLYSNVMGINMQVMLELEKKRAASLLAVEANEELSSEVELG